MLSRAGTEGVTAVAEPQQTDQLAALEDKGARRLGKKHTNTGICRGGDSRLQSAQTPNTAGSAANTCAHTHTHRHRHIVSSTHTQLQHCQPCCHQSLQHPGQLDSVPRAAPPCARLFTHYPHYICSSLTEQLEAHTHAGTLTLNAYIPSSPSHASIYYSSAGHISTSQA